MTAKSFLGEFEHMVLAAVVRLGDDAYGAAILTEICEQTGRRVPGGSLYVTLDRLEAKGLVSSHMGSPDKRRGGRPKRYVAATDAGLHALADVRRAMLNLWSGIEDRLEEG